MTNYAAQAAMKCDETDFQEFLSEVSGMLVGDKNEAGAALRYIAKVDSRSAFNTPEGLPAWRKVQGWFKKWRQGYGRVRGSMRPPFLMGQFAFDRGCDLDDNPFSPDEGPEIDKPHDLWSQGFKHRRACRDWDIRGAGA